MKKYNTRLQEYMPWHINQIRDILASGKAIDTQIEKLWDAVGRWYDNAFIDSADEYGISIYEKELGITPDPGETLEERRAYVKMMWNYSIPFTDNYLMEYLAGIYGDDGYTYEKKPSACEIYITVASFDEDQNGRVKKTVREMMPAHEWLSVIASIPQNFEVSVHAWAYTYAEEEIAPTIREGYTADSRLASMAYTGPVTYRLEEREVKE